MTSRIVLPSALLLAGLALTACEPAPPQAAGVGFGDYGEYQRRQAMREAELLGTPGPSGIPVSDEGLGSTGRTEAEEIAAAATAAIGRPAPAGPSTQGQRPARNNPGISDEQNFDAVSARETIESDAERLARLRAARQEVRPQALPDRPSDSGPNIVEYALRTSNQVGQPLYDRGRTSETRHARNCAEYTSQDRAQMAFLEMGGPARDRQGLDPDGDGFACAWDPAPFRAARGG